VQSADLFGASPSIHAPTHRRKPGVKSGELVEAFGLPAKSFEVDCTQERLWFLSRGGGETQRGTITDQAFGSMIFVAIHRPVKPQFTPCRDVATVSGE